MRTRSRTVPLLPDSALFFTSADATSVPGQQPTPEESRNFRKKPSKCLGKTSLPSETFCFSRFSSSTPFSSFSSRRSIQSHVTVSSALQTFYISVDFIYIVRWFPPRVDSGTQRDANRSRVVVVPTKLRSVFPRRACCIPVGIFPRARSSFPIVKLSRHGNRVQSQFHAAGHLEPSRVTSKSARERTSLKLGEQSREGNDRRRARSTSTRFLSPPPPPSTPCALLSR